MILEGLVTTIDADGQPHLAPMGPRVGGPEFRTLQLRPYSTSQTCRNLIRSREGVLHVTDDALLIACAAISAVTPMPPLEPAVSIQGHVLLDCQRYYEFRVSEIDTSEERVGMTADVTHTGRGRRPWFGFNRARHAVLEAAILATRVHLLPREQIEAEFRVLTVIVGKTGGPDEHAAMQLLRAHVEAQP